MNDPEFKSMPKTWRLKNKLTTIINLDPDPKRNNYRISNYFNDNALINFFVFMLYARKTFF
jgi:hypothetical protein